MMPITLILALLFALACSWMLTKRLHTILLAKGILDIPNERSSHTMPIPRGGGLAVMGTIMIGLLGFALPLAFTNTLLLIAALLLLLFISWIDDKKNVSAALRLLVHLIAATVGSFALGEHAVLFGGSLPFWIDRLLMILGWGWFMNLYNFMDGIDGMTSLESISCATGVGLLLTMIGTEDVMFSQTLCVLIIGACLGFLKLNWHPAKIFLGDSGSVPLGFLIGFLLLKLATIDVIHLLPAFLIALYYIADSGVTLAKRAIRGEKIWQAHRQHYYQGATAGEGSPIPVVIWILITNTGLIACAMVSIKFPWLGAGLGVGILLLLLAKLSHSARKVHRL